MIDKSQILNFKPEPQTVRLMKMIVPTSSPTIGNTYVMGSTVKFNKLFLYLNITSVVRHFLNHLLDLDIRY